MNGRMNYSNFSKKAAVHEDGLDTHMTVWSYEELCEIRGDLTLDEAEFRYLIVGGSARNFRRRFPSAVKTLEFVESVMSRAMRGTDYQTRFRDTFDGYCRLISRELNKSNAFAVMNSLMRHLFLDESK
jgi:hypothetical protein